jgi:hypothetical protein
LLKNEGWRSFAQDPDEKGSDQNMPAKPALKPVEKPEKLFPFSTTFWTPIPGSPLPLDLWESKNATIVTRGAETFLVYKLTPEEIAAVSAAYPLPKRQEHFAQSVEQPARRSGGSLKKNLKPCRK